METLTEFESKEYDFFKESFAFSFYQKNKHSSSAIRVNLYKFIQYDGSPKSLEILYNNSKAAQKKSAADAQLLLGQAIFYEAYQKYMIERQIRIEAFNLSQNIKPLVSALQSPTYKI